LIENSWGDKKPLVAACLAPSNLQHPIVEENQPLLKGEKVRGLTNAEEDAIGLTKVVSLLLEKELKSKGGIYTKKEDWAPYLATDSLLIND